MAIEQKFVEAKIILTNGEEEYFAMPQKMAERMVSQGHTPAQFHTTAGEFYEVESITIDNTELKPETS